VEVECKAREEAERKAESDRLATEEAACLLAEGMGQANAEAKAKPAADAASSSQAWMISLRRWIQLLMPPSSWWTP